VGEVLGGGAVELKDDLAVFIGVERVGRPVRACAVGVFGAADELVSTKMSRSTSVAAAAVACFAIHSQPQAAGTARFTHYSPCPAISTLPEKQLRLPAPPRMHALLPLKQ
jgi:hypothetical protein